MAKQASVAPKERINIVYKPAGDATKEIELPLKLLMMGDYTLQHDPRLIEDRKPVSVDKDNFNEVMKAHQLALNIEVPNRLKSTAVSEEALKLKLSIRHMRDFEPDRIAEQVPELNRLLQIRDALIALKGPLGNVPAFRKKLQQIIKDDAARRQLCQELNIPADVNT